jgi:hypothetical protein
LTKKISLTVSGSACEPSGSEFIYLSYKKIAFYYARIKLNPHPLNQGLWGYTTGTSKKIIYIYINSYINTVEG